MGEGGLDGPTSGCPGDLASKAGLCFVGDGDSCVSRLLTEPFDMGDVITRAVTVGLVRDHCLALERPHHDYLVAVDQDPNGLEPVVGHGFVEPCGSVSGGEHWRFGHGQSLLDWEGPGDAGRPCWKAGNESLTRPGTCYVIM